MVRSFGDKTTADIYNHVQGRHARRLPVGLHRKARIQLAKLEYAAHLADLKSPPSNRLEALKGNLKGFHSIRINDQWRIIFRWQEGHAQDVQIIDYH